MKTDIKLAWRNLWRNKRRSVITVTSIFFGVILSTYMTSMQEGSYDKMVENAVRFYSGHIQIHNEEFWDNKTINNTFLRSDSLEEIVSLTEGLELVVPRLESFALASSDQLTKGAMVLGIDSEQEDKLTNLRKKLVRGNYLDNSSNGILMGESLAKYLQVDVADTLVLISQGYHGVNAAGLFPVKGIIKHPSPVLDKQIIYMNLPDAQEFYSAYNLLTSLAITVNDLDELPVALRKLKSNIDTPYSVMSWAEMQPELVQMIDGDRSSGVVVKLILFVVIGFGIFGTIIMMVAERRREFGVLVSVGMQKTRLAKILIYETFMIGILGIVTGTMASLPILYYHVNNPILMSGQAGEMYKEMGFEPYLYFSLAPKIFTFQILIIFIIVLVIAIYPIVKALKLKENKAIRA
jgi:ABC-type lipoprotein release transport system permease subunit